LKGISDIEAHSGLGALARVVHRSVPISGELPACRHLDQFAGIDAQGLGQPAQDCDAG
jgi:hypothetical protein